LKNIDVHIFIGEDEKLIKSDVNKLEKSLPTDSEIEYYFADDTPFSDIISSMENLALFGNEKVIKVYSFDTYLSDFIKYLSKSRPSNKLVLISFTDPKKNAKKLDKLKNKDYIKINTGYKIKNASQRLLNRLNQDGIKLTSSAKRFLVENFDTAGDIDDVAILLNSLPDAKKTELTLEDIYPHVTGTTNFFAFMDNVFDRNFQGALIEFEKLYTSGESLIKLLNQLHNNLKGIWQAKALYQKNASKSEIIKQLKKHPFVVEKFIRQSNNFSFQNMSNLFEQLHKTDISFKSLDKNLYKIVFEKLLLKFCVI
jgi:DNA polymerase III delta subunit